MVQSIPRPSHHLTAREIVQWWFGKGRNTRRPPIARVVAAGLDGGGTPSALQPKSEYNRKEETCLKPAARRRRARDWHLPQVSKHVFRIGQGHWVLCVACLCRSVSLNCRKLPAFHRWIFFLFFFGFVGRTKRKPFNFSLRYLTVRAVQSTGLVFKWICHWWNSEQCDWNFPMPVSKKRVLRFRKMPASVLGLVTEDKERFQVRAARL